MVASAVSSGSRLGQASLPLLPPGFRFKPTDEELASHYLYPRVRASDDGRRALAALTDNGNDIGPAPDCSWINIIASLDVFDCEPWQLPPCCRIGDESYFFARRSHKYGHSRRTNRCTTRGYWKATGNDRTLPLPPVTAAVPATTADTAGGERAGEGEHTAEAQGQGQEQEQYWVPMLQLREGVSVVGMKKTLVFYEGRAPRGKRTDWVMHEYRLEQRNSNAMAANGGGGGSGIGSGRKPVGSLVLCRVVYKGAQPPSDPAIADATQLNATTTAAQTAAPPASAVGGAEYRRLEGEGEDAQESDEETAEEGAGAGYASKDGVGVKVECVTDGLQGQQQAEQHHQQQQGQDLLPWLEDLKLLWEVEAAEDAAATELVPAAAGDTASAGAAGATNAGGGGSQAVCVAPEPPCPVGSLLGDPALVKPISPAAGAPAHAQGRGEGEWEEERGGDTGTELTTAGSTCASVPAAAAAAVPSTGHVNLAASSAKSAPASASAAAAAAAAAAAIPPLPPLNILESLPSLMFGSDDIGKMLQAVDGSIMNPYEGLENDGLWLAGPSPLDGEHFAPPSAGPGAGGVGGGASAAGGGGFGGGGGGGWEQSGRDPNVDAAVAAAAAAAAASGFAVEDVNRGWTEELERIVKQEAPSKRRRCQAAALAAALAGQGSAAAALAGKAAVEAEEHQEDSESEDGVGSGRETFLGGSGEESGESDGLDRGRGGVGGVGKAVGASSSSTCSSSEADVLKMQQANARRLAVLVAQKCTVSASHERRTSPRGYGREDVATGVEESEEIVEQEDRAAESSGMATPEDGDQTSEALSSEQASKNNICVALRQIVLLKGRPMLVVPPKGRLQ
ncbi:unnamed protein product [Closterium sp. NIES-65]|nr:unnamed protein product [Closterium sp. NIES-65]